jgi:hypothetical protein
MNQCKGKSQGSCKGCSGGGCHDNEVKVEKTTMTTLEKAIEVYGKDMQLNVAIEEFSELIKEICKYKRGEDNRENIIEEMADCQIMLSQLGVIFGIWFEDLEYKKVEKLERLEKRLAESEGEG